MVQIKVPFQEQVSLSPSHCRILEFLIAKPDGTRRFLPLYYFAASDWVSTVTVASIVCSGRNTNYDLFSVTHP